MFDPILQREVTSDEYFTPAEIINKHIQGLDINEKFIDNCCGTGNWLIILLKAKIDAGIDHATALSQLYGVELQADSAKICRERLLLGKTDQALIDIVEKNIFNGSALNCVYSDLFNGLDAREPIDRLFE
jgi:type I restriction-modification system DNA methylase subunit